MCILTWYWLVLEHIRNLTYSQVHSSPNQNISWLLLYVNMSLNWFLDSRLRLVRGQQDPGPDVMCWKCLLHHLLFSLHIRATKSSNAVRCVQTRALKLKVKRYVKVVTVEHIQVLCYSNVMCPYSIDWYSNVRCTRHVMWRCIVVQRCYVNKRPKYWQVTSHIVIKLPLQHHTMWPLCDVECFWR